MRFSLRTFALDDIRVRSGGDGRTVEAYAAVFNRAVDISDWEGEYSEQIHPQAFKRTLDQRGLRFGVFYNHAATIHGTPSERGSLPIGTPLEVRSDDHGLWTVSRYNKTQLADEVLEAIRNGDIRGQSFSGRFLRSDPGRAPRMGWKRDRDGNLPVVTRMEIALREYGPTPFPAYEDAAIVGVRSLLDQLGDLSDEERGELAARLAAATPLDPAADGTPDPGPASEDPPPGHSVRQSLFTFRAALRQRGIHADA